MRKLLTVQSEFLINRLTPFSMKILSTPYGLSWLLHNLVLIALPDWLAAVAAMGLHHSSNSSYYCEQAALVTSVR